jgi:hypothetical protein
MEGKAGSPGTRAAIGAGAVIAGTAAAVWLAWSGQAAPGRALLRLGPCEYQFRRAFGVGAGYPERVCGGDAAAQQGDFPAWADELAGDGLAAWDIIDAVRRESEW